MLVLLREISFRHWMRARLRTLLVVLGIGLGVALYVATEAAMDSVRGAYADLVERIAGRADLVIQRSGGGLPGELVSEVMALPGVAHAAPTLEVSAQAPELGESLLVLGVDMLGDLHFLPFQEENPAQGEAVIDDPISFMNDPLAVLLSRRFAQRHQLSKGSAIQLLTSDGPKAFRVRGLIEDSGAAATFGGQVAVMFLDAAQISFGRGTSVDRIDVAVSDRANLEATRSALAAAIGDEYRVDQPEQVGARLRALAAPLEMGLAISGFLAIVVGSFLVYNAISVAVTQRRREVGILRALGETRSGMVQLFMLEAIVLALPGAALGLALGRYLGRFSVTSTIDTLDTLYAATSQIAPDMRWDLALRALVAALLIAVVSAYFPARRGTAFDPAIVLRGTANVEFAPPSVRRLLLGALVSAVLSQLPVFAGSAFGGFVELSLIIVTAALATPALVVGLRALFVRPVEALLGIPGRLGLDYVERSLSRSTVNVLALMVAVGMSISTTSWLASFEHSLAKWAQQVGSADLLVTRGSPVLDLRHVPLHHDAAERVRAVAGVGAVQRFRMTDQQVGDVTLRLVASDRQIFLEETAKDHRGWEVTDGEPLRPGDLSKQQNVVLSENAARLLHVSAGDSLHIATPARGAVQLTVRAVVVDYTSDRGTGFVDLELFREWYRDDAIDGLSVYLDDSRAPDVVADQIRKQLASDARDASVFVSKTSSVQQHLLSMLDKAFSYSHAVELLTLVIGLMGVVGTMVAAVMDRQRELSMLRAIGATRSQVALSIVVEAAFLGFCAAVAGILVGVVETKVFFETLVSVQTGWRLTYVFPWQSALRTTVLVVMTSALAGAIPAYRALRRETLTAPVAE